MVSGYPLRWLGMGKTKTLPLKTFVVIVTICDGVAKLLDKEITMTLQDALSVKRYVSLIHSELHDEATEVIHRAAEEIKKVTANLLYKPPKAETKG